MLEGQVIGLSKQWQAAKLVSQNHPLHTFKIDKLIRGKYNVKGTRIPCNGRLY